MHFAFEAVFIGLYTMSVFWALRPYIFDRNILLFVTGFIKHLSGYFLGLHTYYCKFGNACERYVMGKHTIRKFQMGGASRSVSGGETLNSVTSVKEFGQIAIESIAEGVIFVIFGILAFKIFGQNKYLTLFIMGFMLHILFEIIGIHHMYCLDGCSRR